MAEHQLITEASRDKLLTPQQAAELLTVSLRTLDRYQSNGIVRPVRTPGRQRRFWRSDIEALLTPTEVSA